jgi:hypothetical protein
MVLAQVGECVGISGANFPEQIFRLVTELFEVGTDREMTAWQDDLLLVRPGVRCFGRKGESFETKWEITGGLSPVRGPEASCTPEEEYDGWADGCKWWHGCKGAGMISDTNLTFFKLLARRP